MQAWMDVGSWSEDTSSDSASTALPLEKKKHYIRQKFTSYPMYMIATFGIQLCLSDLITFAAVTLKYKGVTFLIPFIVVQIFVAVPVCMGQILLGQYGMVGQISVWRITPLMYGIGFSMLAVCLLYAQATMVIATYTGIYVAESFQYNVPWADCSFSEADPRMCEDRSPGKRNLHGAELKSLNASFNIPLEEYNAAPGSDVEEHSRQFYPRVLHFKHAKGKQNPAFHYFSMHLQVQVLEGETQPGLVATFKWKVFVSWCVIWLFAVVFVCLGFARILKKGIIRDLEMREGKMQILSHVSGMYGQQSAYGELSTCRHSLSVIIVAYGLCCVSILFIIFMEMKYCDISHGLRKVFTISTDQMTRLEYWIDVLSLGITNLLLATGAMILYGSYLTAKWRPDTTALLIAVVKTLASLFFASVIIVLYGKEEVRYPPEHYTIAGEGMSSFFFPVVTSFMSVTYATHVFVTLFFMSIIFYAMATAALHILVITECLSDTFIKARRFKKYITLGVCLFFGCLGIPFFTQAGEQTERCMLNSLRCSSLIIGVMFSLFTFLVYGSQKLADDMEFITQVRLPKVWRIMWIVSVLPLVGTSCFLGNVINNNKFAYYYYIFNVVEVCVILSPILIIAIVVYFKYLKNRALLALIRPSNDWEPQDLKKKRRIFKPREAVKCKNPLYTCKHRCLIGHDGLKQEIERLDGQRRVFMEHFATVEEDSSSTSSPSSSPPSPRPPHYSPSYSSYDY